MYITNTVNLVASRILLCFAFGILAVSGQDMPTTSALVGSKVQEEIAVKKANVVAIGKFKTLGEQPVDMIGEHYRDATVEIGQTLKGNATGKVSCYYARRRLESGGKEDLPQLNVDYILFLEVDQFKEYAVWKLLPKTDETVTRINALITALAQPQDGSKKGAK